MKNASTKRTTTGTTSEQRKKRVLELSRGSETGRRLIHLKSVLREVKAAK